MKEFKLGLLTITKGVDFRMRDDPKFAHFVKRSLGRYKAGDWGDTCEEDAKSNDYAVKHGERILAVYDYDKETKIWIITEWDRSVTTILYPSEY